MIVRVVGSVVGTAPDRNCLVHVTAAIFVL